jgi:hypothetical protein
MREIPLHLQRRFEQRWAARFSRLGAAPIPPESIGLKDTVNSLPILGIAVEHTGKDKKVDST